MRIIEIRTFSGPNFYSHNPVLLMRLDLQDLTGKESFEIPGLIDRMLVLLPGLHSHYCSLGRPGGFLDRLREGTFFGHIVEHVALELTELAGVPVTHGKTRETEEPGVYNVAIEYTAEQGTRFLLNTAVGLVENLVQGIPVSLDQKLDQARWMISRTELGPSTRAIVNSAISRGVPCNRVGDGSVVQLGYGKYRKLIEAAISSNTSCVAADIAANKALTKRVLYDASIPVPLGEIVEDEGSAVQALTTVSTPVVVKPLDGHQGDGVSLNVTTPEEMRRAFKVASKFSGRVLIEELFTGNDYRVLVINGKMVAASLRQPCSVVGDGERTIGELLEIENRNPLRGEGHEKPLTRIVVDSILVSCLEKQGMSLDTRPAEGERVYVLEGANLSKGGTARDVTELVHPEISAMCERAARIVGLDICGIDLITDDISQPLGRGGVIEINASPGLRMHVHPSEGMPRDVGTAIVEMLYPPGSPSRVPIISITGTNGKTTVTRMIGHVISQSGLCVGMTTTDGIYIASRLVVEGDTTGPHSARTVLADPLVEVAVLETARGGIVRRGLGYDWSDIGIITNIQSDHIGQDGIKTIDDLVYAKSLVAERVREGGTLILNADDEQLSKLMGNSRVNKLRKNVVYFASSQDQLLIRNHLSANGVAYYIDDGWITEAEGERRDPIIRTNALSASFGGTATFQLENVMAAIAACRSLGLSATQVAPLIATFGEDQHNPGRLNLYQLRGAYVLIDYGHNPRAFESVGKLISSWPLRNVTAIVGVPGDRCDSLIGEAGRKAAEFFQRIIIREDKDLRGRKPGEVARLLSESITGCSNRKCEIVLDEREALERELGSAEPGDLVIVFYEDLASLENTLKRLGARAVNNLDAARDELESGVIPALEPEAYKSASLIR